MEEENTQIYAYSHTEMTEAWEIWILPLVYQLYIRDVIVLQFLLLFLKMDIFYSSFC